MKSKKQDALCVAPLPYGQDDLLTKLNISIKHLQSVSNNDDVSTMPRLSRSSYPTMSHITIDTSGVENLLRNYIPHEDTGPDAILAILL